MAFQSQKAALAHGRKKAPIPLRDHAPTALSAQFLVAALPLGDTRFAVPYDVPLQCLRAPPPAAARSCKNLSKRQHTERHGGLVSYDTMSALHRSCMVITHNDQPRTRMLQQPGTAGGLHTNEISHPLSHSISMLAVP